ncbi:MAG TPA: 16S rRNA (guanine(527)-N(7))-methyltransferase RsmG [Caulobacteraceae bacterium]|jgi:16S rRNA (guanine527-N7)-methyltransferase
MRDAAGPPDDLKDLLSELGLGETHLADAIRFRQMLEAGNTRMNLVGASTLADFWRRHFLDSAQLLRLAPGAKRWVDLGAGAGFPGVVLAIFLKGEPGAEIHLVDSMVKRCAFLKEVVEALALPAIVHNERAEALPLKTDVVTARACAPLTRLLGFAAPSLRGRTRGLFLKGAEVETELAEARKSWRFKVTIHPSLSDARGRILEITELVCGR